jgi:hypothetical protein
MLVIWLGALAIVWLRLAANILESARCQRGIARGRVFKCDVLSDCGHVDALTQGPRLIACGTAYSTEQP